MKRATAIFLFFLACSGVLFAEGPLHILLRNAHPSNSESSLWLQVKGEELWWTPNVRDATFFYLMEAIQEHREGYNFFTPLAPHGNIWLITDEGKGVYLSGVGSIGAYCSLGLWQCFSCRDNATNYAPQPPDSIGTDWNRACYFDAYSEPGKRISGNDTQRKLYGTTSSAARETRSLFAFVPLPPFGCVPGTSEANERKRLTDLQTAALERVQSLEQQDAALQIDPGGSKGDEERRKLWPELIKLRIQLDIIKWELERVKGTPWPTDEKLKKVWEEIFWGPSGFKPPHRPPFKMPTYNPIPSNPKKKGPRSAKEETYRFPGYHWPFGRSLPVDTKADPSLSPQKYPSFKAWEKILQEKFKAKGKGK